MCGIVGIVNFDNRSVSPATVELMAEVLRHRGPDDSGKFISGNVGLGHRRLSILDLSIRGHQPMSNEDRTIWIVYNGEIYNYRSLNKMLIDRGHNIKSQCDTETIIHMYEEFGSGCVDYLRGMFSFAIWDSKRNKLFAAVDRLKIKPFYYCIINNSFIFASELKSILKSGLYQANLSYEAIHHFLSMQTVPVPLTIYEGIFSLPGGHYLEVNNGNIDLKKYWDIEFEEGQYNENYYKNRLKELIYESIEMRMISDVPIGAFLSGGIDSSVIVAVMKDLQKAPVKTFSIGYDVGGKNYDDVYFANLVAEKFNTNHRVLVVTADDVLSELEGFVRSMYQPSMDAVNSYFVSKLASQEVKVALSGTGGDELFAGYQTTSLILKFMKRERLWDHLPDKLKKILLLSYEHLPESFRDNKIARRIDRFLYWYGSFIKKYGTIRMELSEIEKRRVYSDRFLNWIIEKDTHKIYDQYYNNCNTEVDPVNKICYLDLKTYMGDLFMSDIDRMSMNFSLETRLPLIDHKLVEFTATIPPEYKLRGTRTKYIFIEAVKHLLPEEVIRRPKLGFAFPFPIWMQGRLRPLIDFVLQPDHINERGFFNMDGVNYLKERFFKGVDCNYRKVWGLVVLEMWLRMHFDNDEKFFKRLKTAIKK